MKMRIVIPILTLMLLISACHDIQISKRLDYIDSLIIKEQYDSAGALIKDIEEASMTKEEQSHYYLLKTQLAYLTNQPLSSDSLLDLAIVYYNKVKNNQKLADAYYYKSYRSEKTDDYPQAILYCKEAERLANKTNDICLKYKIAENLSYLNGLCGNSQIQLQYAKKALSLAQSEKNGNKIAYSYNNISFAFANCDQLDSALFYIEKTIPYINYVSDSGKTSFLTNIGILYKEKDSKKAKKYFEKALTFGEHPGTLEHLADVIYDEGNEDVAYMLWQKALTINGRYEKDNIVYNILTYDLEHGNLEEASKNLDKVIAIKDSMLYLLRNDTIKDLQLHFDHEVAMHEADRKLISTQRLLLCLILIMGAMAIYIILRKKKDETLLKDQQMQLYAYTTEINQLKVNGQNVKDAEATIEELNKSIRKLLDDESPKLKQGRMLYDHIMEGGTTCKWHSKEEDLFNNYYAAVNYKSYNRLRKEKRTSKLSAHNLFYLILKEMGKDDLEVMRIMGLSREGLRSLRSRTKPTD